MDWYIFITNIGNVNDDQKISLHVFECPRSEKNQKITENEHLYINKINQNKLFYIGDEINQYSRKSISCGVQVIKYRIAHYETIRCSNTVYSIHLYDELNVHFKINLSFVFVKYIFGTRQSNIPIRTNNVYHHSECVEMVVINFITYLLFLLILNEMCTYLVSRAQKIT